MASDLRLTRRVLLKSCMVGMAVAPLTLAALRTARAADVPLLSPADPAATAVKYAEDASKVAGVPAGNTCGTCALYEGAYGSKQGLCQIFPGKQVLAAGWCSSWSPQI